MMSYPDDMLCASFCGKHTEDTSSASNVENGLSFEQMAVVYDGGSVGSSPYGVLEHLLVNALIELDHALYLTKAIRHTEMSIRICITMFTNEKKNKSET